MKKAIYLLAATALMASCNQDVLVDATNDQQPEVSRRIGFDTFVDKATRAEGTNSTALNDFYPAFNVYGWKVVDGKAASVFNNVTVSYFNSEESTGVKPGDEWGSATTGWYYDNVRYWDKMATSYQFSAYAPVAASDDVNCTAEGLIAIGTETAPIKVEATNLMKEPAEKLAYTGFKFDYMTAQSAENSLDKVTLNFKHLMAKLNIRIKLDDKITTASAVTVQEINVRGINSLGYYTNETKVKGAVSGWSLPLFNEEAVITAKMDKGYSLNAKENYNGYYVLEQLIIPQTIKKAANDDSQLNMYKEACVYVEYTIGDETFRSYSPLANIFSKDATYNFEGGKQYTINITVGPKPIVFDAEVTEWEKEVEGGLNMN